MKNFKKLFSVMLAVMLSLGLAVTTANAADITIEQPEGDNGTHTYKAYQVITGKVVEQDNKKVLTDVVWGSGAKTATDGKINNVTATQFADQLALLEGDAATAYVRDFLADTPTATVTSTNKASAKFEGLTEGYYYIDDEISTKEGEVASKTRYIVKLLEKDGITMKAKASVPTVEKKVQDKNDSDENPALTNLQDSADYDIGDTVPYTVTATIGEGIENYTSYSLQFVDTMSKGLTFDKDSWDIKVGETSIKDLFTVAGNDTDNVWTWTATDIKSKVSAGTKVVLTYTCTLNKDAVVGSAGNPNTVKLKFDNNPNNSGKGTPEGETPEDTNIVFTYKTVFNKVDDNNQPLKGADFKLEKKVNGAWVDVTTLGSGENKPSKTGDKNGTRFEFKGLDDGDYRLTETETPAGYNSIEPIEFTITADHEILSDNPQLKNLTGAKGAEFTMEKDLTEGSLTSPIENHKGATLPETGGIGTTIFTVVGGLLVVGAAIMLITKKRMSAE